MKNNVLWCTFLLISHTAMPMQITLNTTQNKKADFCMVNDKKVYLCMTKQLESMEKTCTQLSHNTLSLAIAQSAQQEHEICVPPLSTVWIMPENKRRILSTTDFKDCVAAALLALHTNGMWYGALSCCPHNAQLAQTKKLMSDLVTLAQQKKTIRLIRFITVSEKTPENINQALLLSGLVTGMAGDINKPLQIWSFDYNEKHALAFSQQTSKDFEIHLEPNGTGMIYLNTTNEYKQLP